MAEEQENPPEEEQAAPSAAAAQDEQSPAGTRRGAYWLGGIALLVALAGAGAGGYAYWQLDRRLAGLDRSLAEQAGEKEEVRGALSGLRDRLAGLRQGQERLGNRDEDLVSRLDTVEDATRDLSARLEGGPTYWRLERIETLLITADRLARLEGDPEAAHAALESADRALRNLKDPGWLEVRKSVQSALTRLEQVPKLDLPGIAFRLDSLVQAAMELPLKGSEAPAMGPEEAADAAAEPAPEGIWGTIKAGAGEFWADVKGLVRLRRSGQEVEPLLPPDKATFLRHNLVLNLEGARLAALRGQAEVYKGSLTEAADWVNRFFDPESDEVQGLLGALEDLRERRVARSLPSLEAPLRTFRELREERGS
jgi:uroporphyrin-3 C-methyltransferase